MEVFKFSELKSVMAWDRRRLRLTFNNDRVMLCDSMNVISGKEGCAEECSFFPVGAYDVYRNTYLEEKSDNE